MKVLLGIFLMSLVLISCDKNDDRSADVLSAEDLVTSQNMEATLLSLEESLNNLRTASTSADRLYWDNLYHQHDATFWIHHDHYIHGQYTHDDHEHQWIPYHTTIDHSHHYHHQFPNHLNDSLVIVANSHHHDNTDHHFTGHDLHQHQVLDSLHIIHNIYHP